MTFFSYCVSYFRQSQFREPQLLNLLIDTSTAIPFSPGKRNFIGWIIHFTVGWIYIIVFDLIWRKTALEPTLWSGAFLGFIAGFVGISGWKIFFKLNPDPPKTEFKTFYLQLLVAHVIFGIGSVILFL